ncbi:uncharacterized protein [Aristolochia californica]|uniref:uncharacterized protein n=1 Tax=Aristolochia californica TaxID=171875 RepID=UPI0035E3A0AB
MAGRLNTVVDALCRRADSSAHLHAISQPTPMLLETIKTEHSPVSELQELSQKITAGHMPSAWRVRDGVITYRHHIYLSPDSPLIAAVLSAYHNSYHEGIQKTLFCLRKDFYWDGLKSAVTAYVTACTIGQCNKVEHLSPAGVLQPL